jgi:hypothetical protein
MKKWIFSMALVSSLALASSPHQEMIISSHRSVVAQTFHLGDPQYVSPMTVPTEYLRVREMQTSGFQGDALKKLREAFHLLELAVNSEEFKDRVINFRNQRGERAFASNNGLTNEEIYQIFMSGKEILQPTTLGEMNFYLKLYHRPWSKVIGYTSETTNLININWKFFKGYMPYDVAANLGHEWTHKIGFDHKSAAEHDSAPYAIGYILGDIAEKIHKRQLLSSDHLLLSKLK